MTEQKKTKEEVAREAAPFLLELIRKYPYQAKTGEAQPASRESSGES